MENRLKLLLHFLQWPWETVTGARLDGELCDDYPALLVHGQGTALLSLTLELEDALEEARRWVHPGVTVEEVDDFLFGGEAPTAYERALLMVPGPGGLHLRQEHEAVFDPPMEEVAAFEAALSEEDYLRGAVAPMARPCAVYAHGRIVAMAGGRLTGGVLDMTFATLAEYRGRGYGRSAISAMIAAYPEALPLWRTEEGNAASLGAALRLGFEPYLIQDGILLLDED